MSGRGFGRARSDDQENKIRRWVMKGRGPTISTKAEKDSKFVGGSADLPTLDFGGALKDNRPIEFLQLKGEYVALHYP